MAAAFSRGIDGYRKMMEARGTEPATLERDIGLRARGIAAATPEAGIEAARVKTGGYTQGEKGCSGES